jgi:cyclic pyranopterin phosphate synthase
MARHFRGTPFVLRFIEYMDVGSSNGWQRRDVVPSSDIIEWLQEIAPLGPIDAQYPGETAERWRYIDGGGEIGVISSVTRAFCRDCTRARLSTDGKLYSCLFATHGHDLRELIRSGAGDDEIAATVANIWRERSDRYSELRGESPPRAEKIEMSYIGG